MKKDSYNDFPSWKGFQEYFPDEFRINEGNQPKEEYFEWEEYCVHLDRYIPKIISKRS